MDKGNELLEKLLSNDLMQTIIAIGTLNDYAKKGETWPLDIMNAAIKRRAGKESVEFYNSVPTVNLRPKEAAYTLGQIIMHDMLLENVAYTQELIACSKSISQEWEQFIQLSHDQNLCRITLGILEAQMSIRQMLPLSYKTADHKKADTPAPARSAPQSAQHYRYAESPRVKEQAFDDALNAIAAETKRISNKHKQAQIQKKSKAVYITLGVIFGFFVLTGLIGQLSTTASRLGEKLHSRKIEKAFDYVEEQGTWYETNGYAVINFEDGKFTLTTQAIGDKSYTVAYRNDLSSEEIKLLGSDEEELASIDLKLNRDTGELGELYCRGVYFSKDIVEPKTFEEVYEPYIEQALAESDRLYELGELKSPTEIMKENIKEDEDDIEAMYYLIRDLAAENGEELSKYYDAPVPMQREDRLYAPAYCCEFVQLDYEATDIKPMGFDSCPDYYKYLKSTIWYQQASYMNPDAKMFNDGYVDLSYYDYISLDFNSDIPTRTLTDLENFEKILDEQFRINTIQSGDTYVSFADYASKKVQYLGVSYEIKRMYFISQDGSLAETLVLYDYKTDYFIPLSNYVVYADRAQWSDTECEETEPDAADEPVDLE